ncbi:Arc family DNA-binding protein [Enterobacter cloacae]|uniref:Arc family DNA-binding protein n=1 Tax=Enterobacter cloacae TaxID=550 RepID=UPI002874ABFF|nr:Arc family DNA-binding protein [Enterobacter cloacae]EJV4344096.1 Arc family DNA-binding protein [Enterobacter hormaechei]MDR9913232.1 Arc family DNA-binding protein [Enterobacter cloacae subsp. cloacae]
MTEKDNHAFIERFTVRFPDGMRDAVAERAKSNGRSMNSEIVQIIEDALSGAPTVAIGSHKELVERYRELAKSLPEDGKSEEWQKEFDKLTIAIVDAMTPLILLRSELVKLSEKVEKNK